MNTSRRCTHVPGKLMLVNQGCHLGALFLLHLFLDLSMGYWDFFTIYWLYFKSEYSNRSGRKLQDFLWPSLRSPGTSFLLHSIDQVNPQRPAQLKGRTIRLHLSKGVVVNYLDSSLYYHSKIRSHKVLLSFFPVILMRASYMCVWRKNECLRRT